MRPHLAPSERQRASAVNPELPPHTLNQGPYGITPAGVCPSAPLGDHLLGPQGARCRHPPEYLLRRGGR
jgi:hypothetical protein